MKTNHYRNLLVLAGVLILLVGTPFAGQAAPPAQGPSLNKSDAYKKFVQDAGAEPDITWDGETGVPTFISGAFPSRAKVQRQSTPLAQVHAFFNTYGDLFRMQSSRDELLLLNSDEKGNETHLRFQQMYQGVPVWSAQMLVHSKNGQITAVNGHYQPDISVNPVPVLMADQAESIARKSLGDAQAGLEEDVKLMIMTYHTKPALVWFVQLYSQDPLGRWYYFIDAHTGLITDYYNNLSHAKSRTIYDANGTCIGSLPGTLIATEGSGGGLPAGAAKDAFDYMGNTYDYFNTFFGLDSYNNAGATIRSSINYGTYGLCSSSALNAFWSGTYFVFGAGGGSVNYFSNAEDVVAHEFTHAVTEYTGDMIYRFQQGALNESISDIFGAFVQQWSTGNANDWTMGEGLGNSNYFRSLSNPTLYDQPDHMSTYNQFGQIYDNGGVHINSGIPNKAAYLMVAGGTFHDVTVTGLGRAKTEQIFYRALATYLSPLSGFNDIKDSTIQACTDLIGAYGISAADCNEVQDAWHAVGVSSVVLTPPSYPNKIYLPIIISNSCGNNCYIYEPNDDVSQAYGPLTSGVTYYAYLQTNGDVDIYHFTTSGGAVTVSLSSLPSGTDYDLYLYNSNGQQVAVSGNTTTNPEYISKSVTSGKYYIYILPYYSVSSSIDSYELRVTYP